MAYLPPTGPTGRSRPPKPISGVGGRRPASEMLGFSVSRVGQRRWVTTQSLAQFGPRATELSMPGFGTRLTEAMVLEHRLQPR